MPAGRAMATRCPACGTVFRLVPDQLRVSEGWVRCGRCSEVFNASESMVDMDTGAHQRLPDVDRRSLLKQPKAAPDAAPDTAPDTAVDTPADTLIAAAPPPSVEDLPVTAESAPPDPRTEPDNRPPPSFVRQADRAARWREPRARLALATAVVTAMLALAAQAVFSYRDLAAARWPALHPALGAACTALGCKIGAAHHIAGLAVQSSGLVRVEGSDLYRLGISVRNRADIELAMPAIDLTLTDAQGRLLSRRVLGLAELGHTASSLSAGRELMLQATLQVATAATAEPVAGYTIELFYP